MKQNNFSTDLIKSSFYLIAISFVFISGLLVVPESTQRDTNSIVDYLVQIADIPNSVTAVILGSRLFDTIGEVIVFTVAGLGVKILLHSEDSETRLVGVQDPVIINLLDFVALLIGFLAIELAIRGHLSPGGGFAAGVAGATSITLLMVSGRLQRIEDLYSRYNAAIVEKFAVVIFIVIAMMSFTSVIFPTSPFSFIPQNVYIPILNVVAGLKVTIGAWSVIRLFITKRGII
ncbi:MnhB domain-containing protein [Synechococcus sp. CC9616]|uniref:MnhB domain-containing protein n=1 Tax=Synechococcus sp. CC9616 TaxID=110663 RepID=UPI000685D9B0|nr:MnhB domain-containing protein [Synechococcus sp. CC9616]